MMPRASGSACAPRTSRRQHGKRPGHADRGASAIYRAQGQAHPFRLVALAGWNDRVLRLHPAGRLRQAVPGAEARQRRDDGGHAARRGGHRVHDHHHLVLRTAREPRVRHVDRTDCQGSPEMSLDRRNARTLARILALTVLAAGAVAAYAAGADLGQTQKQATNWTAIGMFGTFVLITLGITKWAAARTKSAADFYTAGGGITGFQNGLAIAGDYMSAASFLGISAAVMASGFDGLIYSIGFLVGWPVITFLMAERLRNLGKFTFCLL